MVKIVLVDDDDKIAALSGASLSSKGYHVEIFTDPFKALEFISSKTEYKILISDNIMPGLNGEELIEKIFNIRNDIVAILATGDDSFDFNFQKYGGRVVIVSKPFKRKDLIDTIERLLLNFP